jgi:hypothetical protein
MELTERFPVGLGQLIFPLVPGKAGTQFFGQGPDARFRGHERGVAVSVEK